MFTVPLSRWIDLREPSRYWRRSAKLPEMGADAERRVEAEMEALRRASSRFNRTRTRAGS